VLIFGYFRAFLAAGVASVVASQWSVPDDVSTSCLMVHFYGQLIEGKNKAVALKYAMLRCKKIYPEPKYWAAFTLFGSFL